MPQGHPGSRSAVLQAAAQARNDTVCSARSGCSPWEGQHGTGLVVPALLKKKNLLKYSCFPEEDFTSSGLTGGQQHSDCRLHPDLGISLIRMKMASAARVLTESSGSFAKGRRAAREGSRADMTPPLPAETPRSPLQTMAPCPGPVPCPTSPSSPSQVSRSFCLLRFLGCHAARPCCQCGGGDWGQAGRRGTLGTVAHR